MQKYGNAANGVDKVAGWITNQADVSAESLSCNYDCNLNFWGVIHKFTVWALRIRSSSSFSSNSLWWVTRCVQRLLDLGTALCHGREHQIYQVFAELVGFRKHQIYQAFTEMGLAHTHILVFEQLVYHLLFFNYFVFQLLRIPNTV